MFIRDKRFPIDSVNAYLRWGNLMYVRESTRPIIEATVSVTPEGVSILRRARVAGVQRPNPESTIVGPMQTP